MQRFPRFAFFRDYVILAIALALAGQWIIAHQVAHDTLDPLWGTLLPGLAIFGSAALLSWAAELAQLEISQSLALAFLALVAVLPEYAVDMYLAWTAAKDPTYTAFAAANMTGANRLLIGLGWSMVLLVYWAVTRKRSIQLTPSHRLEILTLLVATAYAFTIPLKRALSIIDTLFLVGLFIIYIRKASRGRMEEPGLAGPSERLALLPRAWGRARTVGLFLMPPGAGFFL